MSALSRRPMVVSGLVAGLPREWGLAHKTGTGGRGATNDIGVARPPRRAVVFLAVVARIVSRA